LTSKTFHTCLPPSGSDRSSCSLSQSLSRQALTPCSHWLEGTNYRAEPHISPLRPKQVWFSRSKYAPSAFPRMCCRAKIGSPVDAGLRIKTGKFLWGCWKYRDDISHFFHICHISPYSANDRRWHAIIYIRHKFFYETEFSFLCGAGGYSFGGMMSPTDRRLTWQ
jgi:hypothetical protein